MGKILLPGDIVCSSTGRIWGHGTVADADNIYSQYFGMAKHTDMLVTVSPFFKFHYVPEVGDVVVGRIARIVNKKWKVQINDVCEGSLALSAISLPGVMQRRKSEDDEMSMHEILDAGDVVACEIQKISKNGAVLHSRNDQYGKLKHGMLVTVPAEQICPLKTRFLSCGSVNLVVGCNGYLWISVTSQDPESYRRAGMIRSAILQHFISGSKINFPEIMNKFKPSEE